MKKWGVQLEKTLWNLLPYGGSEPFRENDGGELIATAESHLWRSEAACPTFAERLREKMPDVEIKIYQEAGGWGVEITLPGIFMRDSRGAAG